MRRLDYLALGGGASLLGGLAILSLTALAVALIAAGAGAVTGAARLAYLNGRD